MPMITGPDGRGGRLGMRLLAVVHSSSLALAAEGVSRLGARLPAQAINAAAIDQGRGVG